MSTDYFLLNVSNIWNKEIIHSTRCICTASMLNNCKRPHLGLFSLLKYLDVHVCGDLLSVPPPSASETKHERKSVGCYTLFLLLLFFFFCIKDCFNFCNNC